MRLRDERVNVRKILLPRLHGKMREKFNIALRPLDRGKRQIPDRKVQRSGQRREITQHLCMYGRIAHDALLADVFLSGLELRLDEAEHLSGGLEQLLDGWKDDLQRDERYVHHRQVQRLTEILRRDIADVGPLHHDDAGVGADLPRQLAVADVDGEDLAGPLLQQAVGKAAGRCAGVAADKAGRVDAEIAQRLFQLQSAAADVRTGAAADLDHRIFVDIDLEEQGYLVKVEPYNHNVGCCYRCGTVVEPLTSPQWFVKMKPLAEAAIEVVKDGRIKFVPERFTKTYMNWMENVHDWCISRQLWWGHRIPAWYCDDCGKITVSRTDPCECEHCHSKNIHQEEDVLDTWFSSALWPFSTMGWPDKTPELDYWYPTSVMVTGYDIIFFWVARMIFSGMEQMKKEPFHTVFIHGLVRDSQGRKMSKSLGNGIDPLEMAEKYGADALRFNLITGNSPGNDMRFYVEKCEAMRNFCNKIWNASRFVMMNLAIEDNHLPETLETEDKWILSKLNRVVKEVCDNMDSFELGVAAGKIYDFIWDDYCDWYIELTKPRLNGDDEAAKESAQRVLLYVLVEILKLLHPFMPFITEEIWQALPHEGDALMMQSYPEYSEKLNFPEDEANFGMVMDAIKAVRARRSEMNVPPSRKSHLIIVTDRAKAFTDGEKFICKLAYASGVEVRAELPESTDGMVSVITDNARMFMPMAELVDLEKERARMEKELANAKKQLDGQNAKLANENFVSRAPEKVVNAEREKKAKLEALIENLEESLKNLG